MKVFVIYGNEVQLWCHVEKGSPIGLLRVINGAYSIEVREAPANTPEGNYNDVISWANKHWGFTK